MSATGPVRRQSPKDDWETPPELWDQLNRQFDFTLDAAANEKNHKTPTWFGPGGEDALMTSWFGRVWLNPPFSLAKEFVEKAIKEREHCEVIVILTSNATETKWFKRLYEEANELRLLHKRVQFSGQTGNTTGSAIWVLSPYPYPCKTWLWDWSQPSEPETEAD